MGRSRKRMRQRIEQRQQLIVEQDDKEECEEILERDRKRARAYRRTAEQSTRPERRRRVEQTEESTEGRSAVL